MLLSRGSTGAGVIELQRLLTRHGYPVHDDGVFGSGTEAAVKDFQSDHNLKVDGVVGSITLAELRKDPEQFAWQAEDKEIVQGGLLKLGDSGERVEALQRLLTEAGHRVKDDGKFGNVTRSAVMAFQRRVGLVVDGVAGEKTFDALIDPKVASRFLQHKDVVWAAKELGVSVAAILAVSEVESSGKGFFADGRPAILYERHVMRRRLVYRGLETASHIQNTPDLVNTKSGGYIGGVREYQRLERAMEIHRASALESCSWGSYQIMGYHATRLGYKDVEEFVSVMERGERGHLEAFVRFIKADTNLLRAIRAKDWATFARWYNGVGYAKNRYDVKMAEAYARYRQLDTMAV